jgi:hypothetical protein
MYFLANDPGVPETIREEMNLWGLCADEFTDTGHWPHQLYVRDGRRMQGEYILTQHDLDHARTQYDAIGMGSYNIDIREVQRVWMQVPRYPRMVAEVVNEGYLSVPVPPYHVAFSSIRMDPQYMILGHAAGIAAAHAAGNDVAVHRIDIPMLQRVLLAQGKILAR